MEVEVGEHYCTRKVSVALPNKANLLALCRWVAPGALALQIPIMSFFRAKIYQTFQSRPHVL